MVRKVSQARSWSRKGEDDFGLRCTEFEVLLACQWAVYTQLTVLVDNNCNWEKSDEVEEDKGKEKNTSATSQKIWHLAAFFESNTQNDCVLESPIPVTTSLSVPVKGMKWQNCSGG